MYGFLNVTRNVRVIDEEVLNKNRLIVHPNDYIKLAESGLVAMHKKSGIAVIQSDLCEEGKPIATGALAFAVMAEEESKEQP